MQNWKDFKKEILKDPKVKKEYDRLAPQYELISQIIAARIKKKVTQDQLAQKIGTKQSAIARFESGNTNPTIEFIQKLAHALNTPLHLTFSA